MTDPRTTPDPNLVQSKTLARVSKPIADLNRHAGYKRDRQILLGERVTILGGTDEHSYVISEKDGYVGYIDRRTLTADHPVTHRINARASNTYQDPDMKSPDLLALSHGCLINVTEQTEKFARTEYGYIPQQHLRTVIQADQDLIEVAKLYLGTPYLWGGNSSTGIDCSGLIQAALTACGIACPGDSDQQEAQLGHHLQTDSTAQKGDLFFWKGHVAIAVDASSLIHANAYHMACAYEPIVSAIARITAQGDGNVTAHKRL